EPLEGGARRRVAPAAARGLALAVVDLREPVDRERDVDLVRHELARDALVEARAVRREHARRGGPLARVGEEPPSERPLEERLAAEEAELERAGPREGEREGAKPPRGGPRGAGGGGPPRMRDRAVDRAPAERLVEAPRVLRPRRAVSAGEVAGVRQDEREREQDTPLRGL